MLNYVRKIANVETLHDAWGFHCEAMAGFGFDRLIYGYSRFQRGENLANWDDCQLLTSRNDEFFKNYIEEHMYIHAPMVSWAMQNVGVSSWAWVRENLDRLTARQKQVIAYNHKMKVTAGYTISFAPIHAHSKGSIALSSTTIFEQDAVDEIWQEHGELIYAMNQVAHLKFISFPHDVPSAQLSARQRQVLEGIANGESNGEIAKRMGLQVSTVDKHLRLAREKLRVETTPQAILKLSLLNQIHLVAN